MMGLQPPRGVTWEEVAHSLQLPANRRQNKNVCDICYSPINVFNINLEVLHVFLLLVPSLLDADTALYMHVMKSGCGIIVCMYGRSNLSLTTLPMLKATSKLSLHSVFDLKVLARGWSMSLCMSCDIYT